MVGVCLLQYSGFGQYKLSEMYFRVGLMEEFEKTIDPSNNLGSAFWPNAFVAIGGALEKNKWSQTFAYEYKNVMIADPQWKNYRDGSSASGPNHMHSLEYSWRYALKVGKSASLYAKSGAALTLLPYGFYGMKYDLSDSIGSSGSYFGNGITYSLEMESVDGYPTPVNFNFLFGLEYYEHFQNNLFIAVCPTATWGVLKYHVSSGYYKDYSNNTYGNFRTYSRGSFAGILFKIGYRFPNNEAIDYVK